MKDVIRHIMNHYNTAAYAEGYKDAEMDKEFSGASAELVSSAFGHGITDSKMNFYYYRGYCQGRWDKGDTRIVEIPERFKGDML